MIGPYLEGEVVIFIVCVLIVDKNSTFSSNSLKRQAWPHSNGASQLYNQILENNPKLLPYFVFSLIITSPKRRHDLSFYLTYTRKLKDTGDFKLGKHTKLHTIRYIGIKTI